MTSAMKEIGGNPGGSGPPRSIDAKTVQSLRQATGAGLMDCKRALVEAQGDPERAGELLRKWGIARSEKREGRSATEGRIGSYVHHDGRQAALVELRCETDFVARTAEFKGLLADLCLHVVGTHVTPVGVRREDVPADLVERERRILSDTDDLRNKPDSIRARIVDGRIDKFYAERVLLEQPFVKDPEKTVETVVREVSARLGEKIEVARFLHMRLGV
ncbi:MAG: elongation factor Ts [Planctomycetes bacterium]|nr:elongation factor Ts [Planctomycetota bacterium]